MLSSCLADNEINFYIFTLKFVSMKYLILILLLPILLKSTFAQKEGRYLIDSLRNELQRTKQDTSKVKLLATISYEMRNINPKDALVPGLQALQLAERINYEYGKGLSHYSLMYIYHFLSHLPESVGHALNAKDIFENLGENNHLCATDLMLAYLYKDLDKGISSSYMQQGTALLPLNHIIEWKVRNYGTLGNNYRNLGQLDSAKKYMGIHFKLSMQYHLKGEIMVGKNRYGYLYMAQSRYDSAFILIKEGLDYFRSVRSTRMISENLTSLGRIRLKQSMEMNGALKKQYLDEAEVFTREGVEAANSIGYIIQRYAANRLLSDIYSAQGRDSKAFEYLRDAVNDYDSVYGARIVNRASVLSWKIEKALKEQQMELLQLRNRQQKGIISAAISGFIILIIIVVMIINSRGRLKKAYLIVKQQEREISRVAGELEVTNRKMEATNQELEAFSYSVSHDLRAPVRRIEALSEMLREDYENLLDDEGRDLLNRISSSSLVMNHLIEDMLKLSRITRTTVTRTSCNLSEMCTKICDELKLTYPGPGVLCKIEEGIIVEADERLINIVLQNLLDNAFKYSSKTENPEVVISSETRDNKKIILIRDNGAGFDMAKAGRLFTPFQRMHSEDQFIGTGIGLATVKRIIVKHGGTISAESEPGKGAMFSFTFE